MSEVVPKKIKYYRKEKFPTVRDNYRKYNNANWSWIDILNETQQVRNEHPLNYLKIVSGKYNIKYGTLRNKFYRWEKKQDTVLNENKNENKNKNKNENRGGHNKIFTEDEEKNLHDYIINVFVGCNLTFNNEHLKLLSIHYYHQLKKEKDSLYVDDVTFTVSDKWVCHFKNKWKLSSLRTKLNRKSTKINSKELVDFIESCTKINNTIESRFIFNLDETFWRIVNGYYNTIGITNSDSRKVDVSIDPKSGFTSVFLISASGEFYKPLIILKGKTKTSLNKIKTISDNDVYKFYSKSGWINIEILLFVLKEIHKITKGSCSALILDKYSVHTDDIIEKEAKKLNIKLVFVPSGKTSTNQPLDVSLNGPIKSIGRSLSNKIFLKDPFAKYTIENSINSLVLATKKIQKETIIESFNLACNIKIKK